MTKDSGVSSGSKNVGTGTGERIADKFTFLVVFFIAAKVLLGIFGMMVLVGICALPILVFVSIDNPTLFSDAIASMVAYGTGGGINHVMAWIVLIIVVAGLLPAVQKRISGNHQVDALNERIAQLERKLSNASEEIVQLQEYKSFQHKLKTSEAETEKELIS